MTYAASFIFSILFFPEISSAAIAPRWAFLALLIPTLALFTKDLKINLSSIFLFLFLSYVSLSFFWSTVGYDFLLGYSHLLILCGAFFIGASIPSIRSILIGAAIGLGINSIFVGFQTEGWSLVQQSASPAGLFMNKNLLAEFSALILVGLLYEKLWWWAVPVLPCLVFTQARGAIVAVIVAVALGQRRSVAIPVIAALAVFGVSVAVVVPGHSFLQRLDIWKDTIENLTWIGHGWGQFFVTFPQHATHMDTLLERPEHAHNDFLELTYELGFGAILLAAFIASIWRSSLATEKAILAAFLVEGLFGFPFYIPTTAVVFAIVAGRLSAAGPDLRDDFNACRMALRKCLAADTELRADKQAVARS
jgi:hypothetical protein